MRPGNVRPRPQPGHSQAHKGVSPLNPVTHRNTSFQPLPRPLDLPPYHYDIGEKFPDIAQRSQTPRGMVFHVVGDTGGVQDGEFQNNVAEQMIDHLTSGKGDKPLVLLPRRRRRLFHRHADDYYAQFYEPYAHYDVPIFAIPGNHDGEVDDPTVQTSLDGWVDYFMQAASRRRSDFQGCAARSTRSSQCLLDARSRQFATIIGMYTNVPEGGSIDSAQQQWVTNEFATAPKDRALILALHHPIYSFDVYP